MNAPVPTTITVGPHTYKVVIVPGGILGDAGNAGHCAHHSLTIAIDDAQAPSQVADTLLHELVHAMLVTVDLGDDEERVALILGPALLLLLRSNPDLVNYIMAPA